MEARFKIKDALYEDVLHIANELGIPSFIAHILVARGIDTPQAARDFFDPVLGDVWRNPYGIDGMDDVVQALYEAIEAKKHIVVFGDFDLDGISSTCVMTRGIRALGGRAMPFIPKRFEEGYGITKAAFERVRSLDPDLIVTVDCGISCRCEIEKIRVLGIDVVVTDHHEGGAQVPADVPICDPKLDKENPSAILAGVGVALKVIQALGSKFGFPHLWRSYTDFATLGTIADLMAMRDENRALVVDGLEKMNAQPRTCIAALLASIPKRDSRLTSTNLGFSIIPRLNAAGRVGDAELALDLLMSDSYEEAASLASELERANNLRREIEAELAEVAQDEAQTSYDGGRVLVVAGKGWHEGVKGIVASRLTNEYGVPSLLFTIDGEEARGSGRSVGNVNLFKAVESTSDLLTRFGGHGAAVGVTLPKANLDLFRARLCEYMSNIDEEEFTPSIEIDVCVDLSELTLENVEELQKIAPYGQENPDPVLLAKNVVLTNCKAVGADANHLSCKITDGRTTVSAIFFHCKDIGKFLDGEHVYDVAFHLTIDEWRGEKTVKAMIVAIHEKGVLQDAALGQGCIDQEAFDEAASRCSGDRERPTDSEDGRLARNREHWRDVARADPGKLESAIMSAIIGDNVPHEAQLQVLNALERGASVLAIMATGRGKSLIFQAYAAKLALRCNKASLFVYPLRALMADQAFHLRRQFAQFGIRCAVLNGETEQAVREEIYEGLASKEIDIILTTPEFLSFHADRIAECKNIAFVVVDEAHHVGQANTTNRPGYLGLKGVLAKLGNPPVLAVSATANRDVALGICDILGIDEIITDDATRPNLHLDDARGVLNRDDYLAHTVASGEKTIIYVNSREHSIAIARRLRKMLPCLAPYIGFYNAGMHYSERAYVEELFRNGTMRVLVATSAFGEGVNIPDIRHVVLYHMPFSDIEFNQMSGRCGRDGHDAWIHLLYGKDDLSINESILSDASPTRDVLVNIYKQLRLQQREMGGLLFDFDAQNVAKRCSARRCSVTPSTCECGVRIFGELGLVEIRETFDGDARSIKLRVVEDAPKTDLNDSVRYLEGLEQLDYFRSFCSWAMGADAKGLIERIIHPITPEDEK